MNRLKKISVIIVLGLLVGMSFSVLTFMMVKDQEREQPKVLVEGRNENPNGYYSWEKRDGKYDLDIWTDSLAHIEIKGLEEPPNDLLVRIDKAVDDPAVGYVIYVDSVDMDHAKITLPRTHIVSEILYSETFDPILFKSDDWVSTDIPFTVDSGSVTFEVEHFSAYGVVEKLNTYTVTNTDDNGEGSLRQAILDANANYGLDMIEFNIPADDQNHHYYQDDGVIGQVTYLSRKKTELSDDSLIPDIDPDYPHSWWTIKPGSALPVITDPVIIDGYTQPGAKENSQAKGSNAILKIELDGAIAGFIPGALYITGGESTIRGLVIQEFGLCGIQIDTRGDNVIEGNYIGTDVSASIRKSNFIGVNIYDTSRNIIGGEDPQARNIISGNHLLEVFISGDYAIDNRVQGNVLGNGGSDVGESLPGVWVSDSVASENLVEDNLNINDLRKQDGRQLIFVDSSVEEAQSLLDGLMSDETPLTTFYSSAMEIEILDLNRDGIEQITEILSNYNDVEDIHILSHGSMASLTLGNTELNAANLDIHATRIESWSNALLEDADILLYGCNIADREIGMNFIETLAELTGADIAASDDPTGSAQLGGDWELEISTGVINTEIPFTTSARENYEYLLGYDILADRTISQYLSDKNVTAYAKTSLVNGLREVANVTDDISGSGNFTDEFLGAVPGLLDLSGAEPVPPGLGSVLVNISMADAFRIKVAEEINNNFTVNLELDDLEDFLDGMGGPFGDAEFTIENVNGNIVHLSGTEYELRMDLTFTIWQNKTFKFDLGKNADLLGISYIPENMPDVTLQIGFSIDLTFGTILTLTWGNFSQGNQSINDTKVETVNNDFFIRDTSFFANAEISATNLDFGNGEGELQVGFLEIEVEGGVFFLSADVEAEFVDPDSTDPITLSELTGTPLDDLVNISTDGSYFADLPVTVKDIDSIGFDSIFGNLTLSINMSGNPFDPSVAPGGSEDPRTAPKINVSIDFADYLINFRNILPDGVLGLLEQLKSWMGTFSTSQLFSAVGIPFADGQTLANVLGFSSGLHSLIENTSTTDEDGVTTPTFVSIQTFADALDDYLDIDIFEINPQYNLDTRVLTFTIELNPPLPEIVDIPLDFNLDLGYLGGIETNVNVSITPSVNFSLTLGIDLSTDVELIISSTLTEFALRSMIDPSTGLAYIPANGTLMNDTKFTLVLGGLGSADVNVSAYNTSNNNNVSDLADDMELAIKNALENESIDAEIEVKVLKGNRLGLFTKDTLFITINNNSDDDNESAGGFEMLGFMDGQVGSTSPLPVNGVLGGNASFGLKVGTAAEVLVTINQSETYNNAIADDPIHYLKLDIQGAIDDALGSDGIVEVRRIGGLGDSFVFVLISPTEKFMRINDPNETARVEFGLKDEQIAAELTILGDRTIVIEGDPLNDNFVDNPKLNEDVRINLTVDGEPISFTIHAANGKVIGWVCNQFATGNLTAQNRVVDYSPGYKPGVDITFKLAIDGKGYIVHIPNSSTSDNSDMEDLVKDINDAFANATLMNGTPYDITPLVTAGNDSSGQKLMFSPTNLSHTLRISDLGTTRDNEEILDLVDNINKAMALKKLSDGTPLDRIVVASVIGNDTDGDGTINYYYLTLSIPSASKDFLNITGIEGDYAHLGFDEAIGTHFGPWSLGNLSNDATFKLTLDEGSGPVTHVISILASSTSTNDNITGLVEDINTVLGGMAFNNKIMAGRLGNRIQLSATNNSAKLLRVTDTNWNAHKELGLDDDVTAQAREARGRIFIRNASLTGGFDLNIDTTDTPALLARFGFVGINISTIRGMHPTEGPPVALHGEISIGLGGIKSTFELESFELSEDAVFEISFDFKTYEITVESDETDGFTTISELAGELQDRINDYSDLNGKVFVGTDGNRLTLYNPGGERLRLSVDNGSTAQTELGFENGQQTGAIYLSDLAEAITDFDILEVLVNLSISGEGNITLSNISLQLPNIIQNLANELLGNPEVYITISDFTNISTLNVDTSDFGAIADGFDDLNFSSIIDALRSIINLLQNFSMFDFLDEPLPVIGITLNETLGYIEDFLDMLEDFEENPASMVQELDQLLKEALGLPQDSDAVSLSLDNSSSYILRINLSYNTSWSGSLPININLFDLLKISLPSALEDIVNLSGAAGLEAEFSAEIQIGLGINLDNLTVYIYDNTGISLEGFVKGSNVNFVASLGPFGLFVTGGVAVFNEDGDPENEDPAYFTITAFPDPNPGTEGDKVVLGDIELGADLAAGLGAILPCYFPTASYFIGNLDFHVNISMNDSSSDPFDLKFEAEVTETPDFDLLGSLDNLSLIDSLLLIVEGLDMLLAFLENVLSGDLGGISVPLIGDSLSDGAQFIENIRDKIIPKLRDFIENAPQKAIELVQKAIYKALGPDGLKLLILDPNWDNDPDESFHDVQYSFPDSGDELQFNLWLGGYYNYTTPEIDFGLPGLGLDMDGGIEISLSWNLLLCFGISLEDGFYFDTSPWDEFTDHPEGNVSRPQVDGYDITDVLNIGLGVKLFETLTGKLLFLQLDIKNRDRTMEDPDLNSLYGWFNVNVSGGGADERLSFTEIASLDLDFSWGIQADVDLNLTLGIVGGGKWPSIVSEFYLRWGLGDGINNGSDDPLENHSAIPWIKFANIGLNLGSFFSDFLKPIIEEIQRITEPIQPLVDILTAPIPVISDLAGEDITLIDIAGMFGVVDPAFIYALADLITFINSIPTDAGNIVIYFGSFSVGGEGTLDLRDPNALSAIRSASSGTPLGDILDGDDFKDLFKAIDNYDFAQSLGSALDAGQASPSTRDFATSRTSEGGGWSFPIFQKPEQLFGLILGRPADIIVYDMPKFTFEFTYSQFFPIWDGLGAEISGTLGVSIDLSFGYDTYGIQKFAEGGFKHPLDLLKGFYIGDLDIDTGADIPEVTVYGGLSGAVVLNVVVAKAGVGGGIYATIEFNLNDPDGDGKVRIEELLGNIQNGFKQLGIPLGLICIFDVYGKVEARLFAFVEVLFGLWSKTWYFGPSAPLIEFSYSCPKDPILATVVEKDSGDELRLNMGDYAKDRLYGDTTDHAEKFHVKLKSGNTVLVWSDELGVPEDNAQEYSGVTKIVADGGLESDLVDLSGVTTTSITAELVGGSGDDTLVAGDGKAIMNGGLGDDNLIGGKGNDELYGEKGKDILIGNGGDDLLEGGTEDDMINGDAQGITTSEPHEIRGTPGEDILLGGDGDDWLAGGDDDDVIRGGYGYDWIWGDASLQFTESTWDYEVDINGNGVPVTLLDSATGDDDITGDEDADNISGNGGNDDISGGGGPDKIDGGDGDDRIWGDSGFKFENNELQFESGYPVITFPLYGTAGGDNISGGNDSDEIYGEDGNDKLYGDAGNDYLYGYRGSDDIYGGDNDDHLWGGAGNDRMYGNKDNDTLKGEADNDVLFGDDGNVTLVSGQLTFNLDLVKTIHPGTTGDDTMYGSVGDDILLGGPGKDTLNGSSGNDILIGDNGEFDFTWQPSIRASLVDHIQSVDLDVGDVDDIYGGEGDDIVIGGRADDNIWGDADSPDVDGDDVLLGDNGRIDLVPKPSKRRSEITLIETTDTNTSSGGDDEIDGSEGADIILGGVGDDDIIGGLDDDILLGDNGLLNFDTGDGDLSTIDLIITTDNTKPAPGGVDDISGGESNDIVLGGDEGDFIYGDDTLLGASTGDPGEDILIGDQGEIVFENGIITRIKTTDTVPADGGVDTIEGNQLSDTILGGVEGDILKGATGDDIIIGDEGILQYNLAVIDGGDGDPDTLDLIKTITPALGDADTIYGNDDDDIILGGNGGDDIYGSLDDDIILGDNGKITMPGEVVDMIETTNASIGGSDTIEGNENSDIILGGAKDDDIWGNESGDIILGDNGKITMPDEVIEQIETTDPGIGGNDTIEGNDGDDYILGGTYDDDIWGNLGNDVILGDNGMFDFVVDFDANTLDLVMTTDPTYGGDDTIEGNENEDIILGGNASDDIWGNENDDVILGDNGKITMPGAVIDLIETTDPTIGADDTIEGNDGNDIILGGTAGDNIWGNDGDDIILGDNGRITMPDEVIEQIETTDPSVGGIDTIEGNENEDLILGGPFGDDIWGHGANDVILGDNGYMDFVLDIDASSLDLIKTTDPDIGGSDTIEGNEGEDKIMGGAKGDYIWGNESNDVILGDNGRISQPGEIVELIETTNASIGGSDIIEGNDGDDIIMGGAYGDELEGNADMDFILGDNGLFNWLVASIDGVTPDPSTLDLVTVTFPNDGGSDNITCGTENDLAFGGTDSDIIYGNQDNDLLFGDHAKVERLVGTTIDLLTLPVPTFTFTCIFTQAADGGDDDLMHGNQGEDILLGQQGDDDMWGDEDDDDMIGGHNVVGGIDELDAGDNINDIMDGGSEDDVMAGDNAIILRRYDTISPRIRALNGETLYDADGNADVDPVPQQNPSGARGRDITMLDHSDSPTPDTFGNDYMAGGPHEDVMFGELGDDIMQGDASVNVTVNETIPSVEGVDDGDDYIEGNGGDDLIFGNWGQDDLAGGSSDLFGLTSSNLRPDGSDTIFGGAGIRIKRNDPGDESDDGHANDADYAIGDNGNIYRIVGTNGVYSGNFLSFTYDNYDNLTIIPRAITRLDYTSGGNASDIGDDDLIHGEAGDDHIRGMTGNDVLFGEGQDDDIFGDTGHDRIYGGMGQDGVLGDDGLLYVSRNGETETLYGLTKPFKEKFIKMPGPFIGAWVDITGRLKKVAYMLAFEYGGNDTIYGGLGNDWLHGGAGNDGISGAEAVIEFYSDDPITNTSPLPYDPETRKFYAYDAENPRTKIEGFFLNFNATDENGTKINDGKDRIFGDTGHDWLVGGTMNDRLFGGLGDDLMNADDNHDSQGGLNNMPDDPEFADRDFVFGGGGLDVMIFNTGGDRVFDWIGEFNSYIAPYAPFGYPETDRLISPHLVKFLMALGEACGADQTLVESDGELGLVDQKDPRWGDQMGGPRDPQAGNLPATHRDTMGGPEDDR